MCGKLGDFTHALFGLSQTCRIKGVKANLYMYDIGWEYGIENTYRELKPILESQSYIHSFNILKNYHLDPIQNPNQSTPIEIFDQKILSEGYIDLGAYIRSPLLFQACWSDIFAEVCGIEIDRENYQTISFNEVDPRFKDKIILHRRAAYSNRLNASFPYEPIVSFHKKDIVFISTSENDYHMFPYKAGLDFYKIGDMSDWYRVINSGKFLISNLSAPESIGRVLDVPRLIELPHDMNSYHFFTEIKYTNKMHFWQSEQVNNCKQLFGG
jgi:hypothetical protein